MGIFGRSALKSACAYLLMDGKVVTHAEHQTKAGLWIVGEPIAVSNVADPEAVGSNLLAAINASRSGVPHPEQTARIFAPVLKAAGVRSYKRFMVGAKCISVDLSGRALTVSPQRNAGRFFEPTAGITISVDGEDLTILGKQVLEAFRVAT